MRLAIVNALLRLPWGRSRGWPENRDTARWRRQLGVWQWKLMSKDKAKNW